MDGESPATSLLGRRHDGTALCREDASRRGVDCPVEHALDATGEESNAVSGRASRLDADRGPLSQVSEGHARRKPGECGKAAGQEAKQARSFGHVADRRHEDEHCRDEPKPPIVKAYRLCSFKVTFA